MPKKNRSKKGKATQVSFSSSVASTLKPATVTERTATPEGYATQGQRRLPFGQRKYDSDCGSDSVPEWQSEDEDEDNSDEVNPVDCLRKEHLCSFDVLRDEILSRFTELERANAKKFENERHVAKVSLHNALVETNVRTTSNDQAVATLESKVASLERLRAA
ncbi:hypothetical protein BDD12DRAFT_807083 [Trichophaea hybrida]|nr:hypothetical protein BDD12DRAFT_807083 [Trichophaea hybrida]